MNETVILLGLSIVVLAAVSWLLWRGAQIPVKALRVFAIACIVAVLALALCSIMAGIILATWPAEAVEGLRSI